MLLLLAATAAFGLPGAEGAQDLDLSRQPVQITADRLEADGIAQRMTFSGHVVAQQGDVTIYGQALTVFLLSGNREIDRVEISGDVRIVQGERVATGQKGVYFHREGRIVLSGSPRVHQGADFITGDEISVFLNEDRSVVSGQEEGRVKAVLHPQENGQ
ncbi:lipopolysaccharide transport periplasmic protein LptA [Desulfuromonas sp.]|uniref:lipopolysaccharide transport periplasmic protein LptA n=1 Tax=Desulfuromonas sp. TaxID=892 RepID=UPI0025BAF494|nr:lipopolysaccharide transport periplasmic protein LptA [Desulfuromonas sp.]